MELRAEEGFAEAAGWDRTDAPVTVEAEPERERSVLPAVAFAALAALWIALAVFLALPRLPTLGGPELVQFIAAACVPPVLLATLWLLWQRSSRAEARRFGDVARAMRTEAAELERTVAGLSSAIDANRERLAEQVSGLLAMGDAAQAKLGGIGQGVGAEVSRVDAHARGLADAAASARDSVDALLSALPGARAGIEDAGRAIDRSGVAASGHAAELEARLSALADRGREAGTLARGAARSLAEHLADMEARSDTAGARLERVGAELSGTVDDLVARTTATVDGARHGIAAQGEAMIATVGAHQERLDAAARDGADALARRMAAIEEVVERVSGRLDAQRASGELIVEHLRTGIAGVERQLEHLHEQGSERAQTLAASISALGGSADAMTESLRAGDAVATHVIGTTDSLLVALDAASREIDETLPDALARLDARIADSRRVIGDTRPDLLALVTAAESTHDAVEAIAAVITDQRLTLDQLSGDLLGTLSSGRAEADALGRTVDDAIERTRRFSDDAAPTIVQALGRVRDSAAATADSARETLAAIVPEAAARLGAAGTESLRRAFVGTVERQVEALTAATEAAEVAAVRAAERVGRETQAIADQTAIVEARIEQARGEREENDRGVLSRRVAGLIEALNSASIDVAKILKPEISDSAWAAYLKGDRGVFTRRAVRLLDGGDAREIARLHEADEGFRDSVNRYIHDFEAMLRGVLQQPDGSPLGITLLSSDMGKLYVALAQAIERLR